MEDYCEVHRTVSSESDMWIHWISKVWICLLLKVKVNWTLLQLLLILLKFKKSPNQISLFWDVIQCRLVVSYLRFRTTYWSHLQGSEECQDHFHERLTAHLNVPSILLGVLDPWRWDTYFVLETLVTNYQSVLHNMPEERKSHLHRGRSSKSCKSPNVVWMKVAQILGG